MSRSRTRTRHADLHCLFVRNYLCMSAEFGVGINIRRIGCVGGWGDGWVSNLHVLFWHQNESCRVVCVFAFCSYVGFCETCASIGSMLCVGRYPASPLPAQTRRAKSDGVALPPFQSLTMVLMKLTQLSSRASTTKRTPEGPGGGTAAITHRKVATGAKPTSI